jgi:hypothetical protein
MHKEYRTAYRLSVAFLWLRCGGSIALFLLFASFIVSLFDGLPELVTRLVWLVPLMMASLAILRTLKILSVSRRGVPATGTLTEKQTRIGRHGDGSTSSTSRYVFSYTFDGRDYTQKSTWGLQPDGTPPSIGNQIEILVDPDRPSSAIMIDEQSVRPPPLAE